MTRSQRLREAQYLFFRNFLLLGQKAIEMGFDPRFGEFWRPPEMVEIYANDGRGSRNSLHPLRLAGDLILDRGNTYLTSSDDYLPLGQWWERLDPRCRWGGRFKHADGRPKPDGNHFSLLFEGRA